MKTLKILTVALATSAAIGLSSAQAATVNAIVADDRTIQTDGTGNPTALGVQNDGFLRTFGVSSYWRSAIEFDLSGIMFGDAVTNASLQLRDEGSSRDGRIDVYGYNADGVIVLSDALETGQLVSDLTITQANGVEDFSLDVTAFMQSLVGASASFAGVLLVSEDESSFDVGGSDICSSEASNGTATFARPGCIGFGPRLTIETSAMAAVPLPATLPLLIGGLFGMGILRRRRKAA